MTPEDVRPYLEGRVSVEEMAKAVGVSERTIYRVTRDVRRYRTRYTPADEERLRLLAMEGMPGTWIAEDIGHNATHVTERLRTTVAGHKEAVAEWRSAWSAIRQNPTLLALHREFAP